MTRVILGGGGTSADGRKRQRDVSKSERVSKLSVLSAAAEMIVSMQAIILL